MSNQSIFQEKNARLNINNTDLASILETINNLPEAGSGVEDLSTELTEQTTLLTTQSTTIDNIISALQNKAAGGSTEAEDGLLDGSLSGAYVNDRITYLAYGAFQQQANITSVSLPSVTSMDQYNFQSCTGLVTASIPNSIYLGTACFRYCTALQSVDLQSVVNMGNYAFYGCTSLTDVNMPIPNKIGNYIFYGCTALTKVVIRKTDAICTLGNVNSFTDTPIESGTGYIYVPDNLIDSYKAATNWSTYAAQIKPLSELEG